MKERLKILHDAGVISKDDHDKSFEIYKKYFEKEGFNEDKVNVFMTHLAMSLKRINEGNVVDKLDDEIYQQVKESKVYDKAVMLCDEIIKDLYLDIPESEKEYLVLHLGNLLMERM